MTEALEWLIENQDDSDDNNEDDDLDLLFSESNKNEDVAGPSLSANVRKKSLKEACIELFKGGNSLK